MVLKRRDLFCIKLESLAEEDSLVAGKMSRKKRKYTYLCENSDFSDWTFVSQTVSMVYSYNYFVRVMERLNEEFEDEEEKGIFLDCL